MLCWVVLYCVGSCCVVFVGSCSVVLSYTYAGVHVRIQQLLAHVASATRDALVRLLVAVHKAMCVAVVARVERFAADLWEILILYIVVNKNRGKGKTSAKAAGTVQTRYRIPDKGQLKEQTELLRNTLPQNSNHLFQLDQKRHF